MGYIRERGRATVFTMDYKPVHIVTNDDGFRAKLEQYGLEYEVGAEDWTEEEGLHYH